MKIKNIILLSILFISLWVWNSFAEYNSDENNKNIDYNTYDYHYSIFKNEFYSELLDWKFDNINKKIEWYKWDIEFISSEKWKEYINNLEIYKLKLKVLEDLKNNFENSAKNIADKKESILYEPDKKELYTLDDKNSEFEKILLRINNEKQNKINLLAEKYAKKEKMSDIDKKNYITEYNNILKSSEKQKQALITKFSQIEYNIDNTDDEISRYYNSFSLKFWKKIKSMNNWQLEMVSVKLEELLQKYENNQNVRLETIYQVKGLNKLIKENIQSRTLSEEEKEFNKILELLK